MVSFHDAGILSHIKEAGIYFPDHYTLMTDQFDHLPILWDKQKELSAFHGHLSFLCFQIASLRSKERGGNDILLSNAESKAWSHLSIF